MSDSNSSQAGVMLVPKGTGNQKAYSEEIPLKAGETKYALYNRATHGGELGKIKLALSIADAKGQPVYLKLEGKPGAKAGELESAVITLLPGMSGEKPGIKLKAMVLAHKTSKGETWALEIVNAE